MFQDRAVLQLPVRLFTLLPPFPLHPLLQSAPAVSKQLYQYLCIRLPNHLQYAIAPIPNFLCHVINLCLRPPLHPWFPQLRHFLQLLQLCLQRAALSQFKQQAQSLGKESLPVELQCSRLMLICQTAPPAILLKLNLLSPPEELGRHRYIPRQQKKMT